MALGVRGTGIQASSAGSYTVTFPSGTLAGDLAVITLGQGWGANAPSGWAAADNQQGPWWSGAAFYKILTSGDITAGAVTVTALGSYDGVLAITTISGIPSSQLIRVKAFFSRNPTPGSVSVTAPVTEYGIAGALAIYFASNRAASTDTISRGTLQRTANDGSAASGALYTEIFGAGGTVQPTMSYSAAGDGNYQGTVLIQLLTPIVSPAVLNRFITGSLSPASPVPVASALKGGPTGAAYSETITAQGGTSPYTFAVTFGSLPAGLSMSGSGVITGTPTTIGTFTFTVNVTDSVGNTGAQSFSITIAAPSSGGGGGAWVSIA